MLNYLPGNELKAQYLFDIRAISDLGKVVHDLTLL